MFLKSLITLAIGLIVNYIVYKIAFRYKLKQTVREEGPKIHYSKTGTPTMGGISILITMFFAIIFLGGLKYHLVVLLGLILGLGFIGLIDDILKVVHKTNKGLYAWQKIALQALISLVFAWFLIRWQFPGELSAWMKYLNFDNSYIYTGLVILVILSSANAVNLSDGLDGLAGGTFAISSFFYGIISYIEGQPDVSLFCFCIVVSLIAFLFFNFKPAKIFMGDIGSMALGGTLGGLAFFTHAPFLLVIVGGVYVLEALSVIIQVISFKLFRKRVFLMSPLHHHFELQGWTEVQVVIGFWYLAFVFGVLGLFAFYYLGFY